MKRVSIGTAGTALEAAITAHRQAVSALTSMKSDLARAADLIANALADDGRLLVCGNGGSAADAQHIAAELVGRFEKERTPWAALALHADTSALTSIGNDYGFEEVFARQVRAHGRNGDVLLVISTSGKSANILAAIDAARERGMHVVGLTGGSGGDLPGRCDVCMTVPSPSTARVQEAHILIAHVLCGLVEDALS